MLGRGWTCNRIACYFGVKVTSLRSTHIYNLLQKTGAKNQTQLAIYAHLHGYVSIDLIDFGVGSLIGGQLRKIQSCVQTAYSELCIVRHVAKVDGMIYEA